MLKNVLRFKGIQELSRTNLKSVTGGHYGLAPACTSPSGASCDTKYSSNHGNDSCKLNEYCQPINGSNGLGSCVCA